MALSSLFCFVCSKQSDAQFWVGQVSQQGSPSRTQGESKGACKGGRHARGGGMQGGEACKGGRHARGGGMQGGEACKGHQLAPHTLPALCLLRSQTPH